MKVYVDVVFLMHFLLILFANLLVKIMIKDNKISKRKVINVSLITSIVSSIIFLYKVKYSYNYLSVNETVRLFYLILMLLNVISITNFKNKNNKEIFKIVIKIILCQIIIYLIMFSIILVMLQNNFAYTFKVLVITFFITMSLTTLIFKLILNKDLNYMYNLLLSFKCESDNEGDIRSDIRSDIKSDIKSDSYKEELRGFLDTGNLARYKLRPLNFIKKSTYERIIKGELLINNNNDNKSYDNKSYNNKNYDNKNYDNINKSKAYFNDKEDDDEWIEINTAAGKEKVKIVKAKNMKVKKDMDNKDNKNNKNNKKYIQDNNNINDIQRKTSNINSYNDVYFGIIDDDKLPSNIDVLLNKNQL